GSVSASWASTAPPQATLVENSGIIASGVPYGGPAPHRPRVRTLRSGGSQTRGAEALHFLTDAERSGMEFGGGRGVHGEDPRRDQRFRTHRQERSARLPERRDARVRGG